MHRNRINDAWLHIQRLESFAIRCGAPVSRTACIAEVVGIADVVGRVGDRRIVLRDGLTLEQQLFTLVHELTHLLVHCYAQPRVDRTICEYEAEAVERWVGAILAARDTQGCVETEEMTDDLLSCSVARVRWATHTILQALNDTALPADTINLEPQPTIEFNASAGEEIVFNDELHGVRNFVGLT